jgi:DNA-binding MarR family transcriptional regulator
MTDNSRKVLATLKDLYPNEAIAADVAAQAGVSIQAVTGSVNGLVKKGLAVRNEYTTEEGKKPIKKIVLTAEGYDFDPDAEEDA